MDSGAQTGEGTAMNLRLQAFFDCEFAEHEEVMHAARAALAEPFARLVEACLATLRSGHMVVFFGNGGSAADAQHLAAEFCCRFVRDRAPLAGLALTTDSSVLTAIANDYGFDRVFERQIRALCRSKDLAVAISTSGTSPNILLGLKAAKEMAMTAAAFGGGDGGKMQGLADPLLVVPSKTTPRIQEMHIVLGHMLCSALEQELGLV